ncbi:HNH endonuclease [Micromonospora sp. NBC_01796]|uniref:HNH endonuclease n=1 Tax=Micromonospora sp. NBC_01796 TaxID=2975987 RepID=UPI002DD8968B|nr:HNH endonuclease [Micromonospora sp. NBC_01796]WSA87804.1 HNH endonuclease [Micromonospora sp. NBC_01796]
MRVANHNGSALSDQARVAAAQRGPVEPPQSAALPERRQLVLQPRGGPQVRGAENYQKSMEQGIPLADLAPLLGPDAAVLARLYPDGVARLWGTTPAAKSSGTGNEKFRAIRDRRVGDDVLFYNKRRFFARARIVHRFHNPDVARFVWGADPAGATWEHIVALDDITTFPEPVVAAPILRSLNIRNPILRSLTLIDADTWHKVQALLPVPTGNVANDQQKPVSMRSQLTRGELITAIEMLAMKTPIEVPVRHNPLTLLWAIGLRPDEQTRLTSWREFRAGLTPILERYGLPDMESRPAYPFWHLQKCGLWEVVGMADPDSTSRLEVLEQDNPSAGFTAEAAILLKDHAVRARAVRTILTRHLANVDHSALLADVGLAGYESASGTFESLPSTVVHEGDAGSTSRRQVAVQRIIRSTRLAETVKRMYDHRCQVCGNRLETPNGGYSQAAHTRGLGSPHDGPDHTSNILCLCPNHHVLFDTFTIYVDKSWMVRLSKDGSLVGPLRRHAGHLIDPAHLAYHRVLCGRDD